jgi:23S rRNA pseudouridine1911/1915/1917 synthase
MESKWNQETRRLGAAIAEASIGLRLDEFLADKFPFFSRTAWQREILNGVVFINGIAARKPSQRLQSGDELERLHPLDEEPDVDLNMPILWNDGELAAVFKPAGLPMHEAGHYRRKTVAGVLPRILGSEWSPVHRLDRETSGLLLCARVPSVRALLTDMWTNRQVQKTYLAVTSALPKETTWRVDLPIKADRFDRTNRAQISEDGDDACTMFRELARGSDCALIEAKPLTGRTNQIRVHLAAIGLPLIGDKVYTENAAILETYRKEGNTPRVQEMAGYPRHALHAWALAFTHPLTQLDIHLTCDLPEDLRALCITKGLNPDVIASSVPR